VPAAGRFAVGAVQVSVIPLVAPTSRRPRPGPHVGDVMNYTSGPPASQGGTGACRAPRRRRQPRPGGILFLFDINPGAATSTLSAHRCITPRSALRRRVDPFATPWCSWTSGSRRDAGAHRAPRRHTSHMVPRSSTAAGPPEEVRGATHSSLRHMIHAAAPADRREAADDRLVGPVIDEYYAASEGAARGPTASGWQTRHSRQAWPISEIASSTMRDRRFEASGEIGTCTWPCRR